VVRLKRVKNFYKNRESLRLCGSVEGVSYNFFLFKNDLFTENISKKNCDLSSDIFF